MNIDIKELTKIKIEPDEILMVQLGDVNEAEIQRATIGLQRAFEKFKIRCLIVPGVAIQEIKSIKQV